MRPKVIPVLTMVLLVLIVHAALAATSTVVLSVEGMT
jgi:hypothetical protein